jgi:hypothetical protein
MRKDALNGHVSCVGAFSNEVDYEYGTELCYVTLSLIYYQSRTVLDIPSQNMLVSVS